MLSDAELVALWPKLDAALKLILLTGQRPGEVAAMQREHIVDGWWQLPGKPQGEWPGTKNARDHRIWLSEPAQALIESHLQQQRSARRRAHSCGGSSPRWGSSAPRRTICGEAA